MNSDKLSRKLAVILLHADVVESTGLVQRDETLAHQRIRACFQRFTDTIAAHDGYAREVRGDALVAEFQRASDAVTAALAFQVANRAANANFNDDIIPSLRIGISIGEVIIADGTVTGAGVVLAQRLEQLAETDGIVVQGAVAETVPSRLPYDYTSLGEQQLKGFEQPVRAFAVSPRAGQSLPLQQPESALSTKTPARHSIPEKPSIAVLPFANMSNDPEQEYFADGISEDLITALSHVKQ